MRDKKLIYNIARMIPVEGNKNPDVTQMQERLRNGRENFNHLVKSVFSSVMKISALDLVMRDCTDRMSTYLYPCHADPIHRDGLRSLEIFLHLHFFREYKRLLSLKNISVGCDVQGGEVSKDRVNMTMKSNVPFSDEGIPMKNRELVKDGKLMMIPRKYLR